MKKLHTLSEKLKGYSFLAGSILASSMAHAQVRYTDIVPDKEFGGFVPPSFPEFFADTLDLNNDGVNDFTIRLNIKDKDTVGGFSFREQIEGLINHYVNNSVAAYTPGYFQTFVTKYDVGDSIPQYTFLHGYRVANFAFKYGNSIQYLWHNVADKYIGVKFIAGGDAHFGWIRVGVNTTDTIPNIILKSYAYEETPDKKIAVGDTGTATGIETLVNQERFSVYPNPSNGNCVIGANITGKALVSVKDALGKEVYETNVYMSGDKRELPLNLSNLDAGVYFITLKSDAVSLTEKWIKN